MALNSSPLSPHDPRTVRAAPRRPGVAYATPTSFLLASPKQKRLVLRQESAPTSALHALIRWVRRGAIFLVHWPSLRPFTFKGDVADVVLVGSNPLLLALALRKAVHEQPGASFLVVPTRRADPWEHRAIELSPFRAMTSRAVRAAFPRFADEIGAGDDSPETKAAAADWLDVVFRAIASEISLSVHGSIRWIDPDSCFAVVPSAHREDGWTPIHLLRGNVFDRMQGGGWPDERCALQHSAEAAFLRRILFRHPVLDLPPSDPREFVLLANAIVVVSSLPGAFAGTDERHANGVFQTIPPRPEIELLGSAAWRCETRGLALERALTDLIDLLDLTRPLRRPVPNSLNGRQCRPA